MRTHMRTHIRTRRSSEHWGYVVGLGLPLCLLYVVMVPAFVYRILSSPDNLAKVASAHANTRDVCRAHVHMSRTHVTYMCILTRHTQVSTLTCRCLKYKTALCPFKRPAEQGWLAKRKTANKQTLTKSKNTNIRMPVKMPLLPPHIQMHPPQPKAKQKKSHPSFLQRLTARPKISSKTFPFSFWAITRKLIFGRLSCLGERPHSR